MGYGQNLKKILKDRKMTVTELARLCKLNPSTLYTCINRDTSIRYDMALPIANTLDIDVNLICKDNPYRGEEDFLVKIPETRRVLALMEAVRESARTGNSIRFEG